MRSVLQYLVGSDEILHLAVDPLLFQKKHVAEELKDRSCLVLEDDDIPFHIHAQGSRVRTEMMAREVFIVSYEPQASVFVDGWYIGSDVGALVFNPMIQVDAKAEMEALLSCETVNGRKSVYYIPFPTSWLRYIDQMKTRAKSKRSSDTDTSSNASSPTSISSPDTSQGVIKLRNLVEKVSKIHLDNELFRKPCLSFVLPHCSTLFIVTSIGIEAIEMPEIEAHMQRDLSDTSIARDHELTRDHENHDDNLGGWKSGFQSALFSSDHSDSNKQHESTLDGTSTDQGKFSYSFRSKSTNSQGIMSSMRNNGEKKTQKRLWSVIHTDLSHTNIRDVFKPISIHVCACAIPERRMVACGDSDGIIRFYSLPRKGAFEFQLPQTSSTKTAFSTESDPSIGILHLSGHVGPIVDVKYIAKLDLLITGGVDGSCRVWNLRKKRLEKIILPPIASSMVLKVVASQMNTHESQRLRNILSPEACYSKPMRETILSPITSLDVDEILDNITIGYLNGEIFQFKLETYEKILGIGNRRDSQTVKSLVVMSQSQFLVFSNDRQLVRVWDIILEEETGRLQCNSSTSMLYNTEKDILFMGTETGEIRMFKGEVVEILTKERRLREVKTIKPHKASIASIWYHEGNDMLVTLTNQGHVAVCFKVTSDILHASDEMKYFLNFHLHSLQLPDDERRKLIEELIDESSSEEYHDSNTDDLETSARDNRTRDDVNNNTRITNGIEKRTQERKEASEKMDENRGNEMTSSTSIGSMYNNHATEKSEVKNSRQSNGVQLNTKDFYVSRIPTELEKYLEEISTYKIVVNNMRLQSACQSYNDRFHAAISAIENEFVKLKEKIIEEYEAVRRFLEQNQIIIKAKYYDVLDESKVNQTKKILDENNRIELRELEEIHRREREALEQRQRNELKEFEETCLKESTNAIRAYLSVKQAFQNRVQAIDAEGARRLKELWMRFDLCPVHHIDGLNPSEYKILSRLGERSSRTFQAVDFKRKKLVAISVYPSSVRLADDLHHECLVPVYDVITSENNSIAIMEKMDSCLSQYLENGGGFLKKRTIQRIIYDVLRALDYIHSQGMVHREIRPENIFLNEKLHAFIKHLGVMKSLSIEYEIPEGGCWFCPPELFTNRIYPSSDIWSLGIVFGTLLQTAQERAEQPLVCGSNPHSILQSIANISQASMSDIKSVGGENVYFRNLVPPSTTRHRIQCISCASDLELDLLEKMLQFNPLKRTSVRELLQHAYFEDLGSM